MNERLKILRKKLKLNQTDFAKHIGLTQNSIALFESGKRNMSEQTIKSICREFNINEVWLRTGEGEMFIELTRDEEIASFIGGIQSIPDDSFKKQFISMLSKLNESEWEALEKVVNTLCKQNK